jgi:glutaredoxin
MKGQKEVRLFTLSTCSHCRSAKQFLSDHKIDYQFTDLDLLSGAERKAALDELGKHNPRYSFPTILIGTDVIVGFKEQEIREALGI